MSVLAIAAVAEAATGLALLVDPALVTRLLLGVEVSEASRVLGRFAGIALSSLGVACWPARGSATRRQLAAMLTYGLLAALYLAYVGLAGEWVGRLLWPAVAAHVLLTALIARDWSRAAR